MPKPVQKLELFLVPENTKAAGIQQDQFNLKSGTTFLKFEDRQYELTSLSSLDCTVAVAAEELTYQREMILKNLALEADLYCCNLFVQRIQLKWIRANNAVPVVGNSITLNFEPLHDSFPLERIQAIQTSELMMNEQVQLCKSLLDIPNEFKARIYEFKNILENLKTEIDRLEGSVPTDNLYDAQEYRLGITQVVAQYLENLQIPFLYAEAAKCLKDLSPEEKKMAADFARAQVGSLVYGAPFANRAYFKPRGYAGDYEMMNHLYRDELVGKTLFDQCLHKYFVQESAGAAVKNRAHYLFEKLNETFQHSPADQKLRILSVASGPAMEQQLFLKQAPQFHQRQVEFTCLDSDETSLKHAQRQLLTAEKKIKSGFEFKFENMSIRNVIARGLPEQGYDLVYSAGLFDYFSESVARAAAVKLVAAVKDGGRVIIGNFSDHTLSASFMEVILDWHLIYRSEADLLRIFQGLGSKIWVEKEPLGINLFVVIQK
jgi:extracellular factor (EF) 3-hydroxypalmitic acid methyl ester biosynthesis protein